MILPDIQTGPDKKETMNKALTYSTVKEPGTYSGPI